MSSWRKYSVYKRIISVMILSFLVQAVLMAGVTYTRYRSGLNHADVTFSALMNKNEQRINEQFDSIKNIASSVGYSSDVQEYILNMSANERVENYRSIKYTFSLLINANPAVRAIYIANEHGVFLERGGYTYMFDQFRVDYLGSREGMPFKGFFSKIYQNLQDERDKTPLCIFYLPVNTLPSVVHAKNAQFYCAVLFDMAQLLEMNTDDAQNLEILTYDGHPLSASSSLSGLDSLLGNIDAAEDFVVAHAHGENYYVRSFELNVDAPLSYTFITPMDALMGDVTAYLRFSVMMILVCLIITIILLYSVRNSILQPIRQITDDMAHVDDARGIIRPTQAQELNVIASGVNQMLHKLRDAQRKELVHQQRFYQMNLEKTQAELMGYRSQINPHFLFNTLGCMCGMARYHGISELEDLIMAMADSYRYVLRTPDYVMLDQEVAHVKNYMQIMNIRYNGKYHLKLDIDENTTSLKVLSLTLQPLVENAVLHGFSDYEKDVPRTITLVARADDASLYMSVEDNGIGLSKERLSQIQTHMSSGEMNLERKHIALQNIYRRIRLSYGEQGKITIDSQEGKYTRFSIQIPLMR